MATSCPVSTLPVEILGRIFAFLPNCYEDPPKPNTNPPSWLAVTHVCQLWRFASLSYVDLWTNIITNSLNWTKESLRRSGSASITLKIKLESVSGPIPDAVSEALSNYPRTRRIDLEGTNISRLIAHVPVQPALSLDTLSLKERSPRFNMIPDLSFLHEDIPKLTGLLLDCIQFQWSSPGNIFKRTLTELSLALGGIPSEFRPNDTELREILSGLPVLQHLFLAHVFRQKANAVQTVHDIAATPDYPYPRLSLPYLTHLTAISDSSPDLSLFACSFRIPESKALTFAYMHNAGAMNMINTVPHSTHLLSLGVTTLLAQSTPFMRDGRPTVKEPGIRIHDMPDGWSIYFTSLITDAPDEEDDDDEEVRVREVPFLQVCVDTRLPAPSSGPSAHSEIASSLVLNIFAMAQRIGWRPEKITVESSLFNQHDMWRSAFSPLSGLQSMWGFTLSSPFAQQAMRQSPLTDTPISCKRLCVKGEAVRGLLTAVGGTATIFEINGVPRTEVLLPTLSRLDIEGADFTANNGDLFGLLLSAFERRVLGVVLAKASRLMEVFVRRCNITKEQIEGAREMPSGPQKLWWDGQEEGLDTTDKE